MVDKRSGRRKENVSKNVDGGIFIEDSSTLKNGFNLKGLLLTVRVCLFLLSETSVRSGRGSCYFRWVPLVPRVGKDGWVETSQGQNTRRVSPPKILSDKTFYKSDTSWSHFKRKQASQYNSYFEGSNGVMPIDIQIKFHELLPKIFVFDSSIIIQYQKGRKDQRSSGTEWHTRTTEKLPIQGCSWPHPTKSEGLGGCFSWLLWANSIVTTLPTRIGLIAD